MMSKTAAAAIAALTIGATLAATTAPADAQWRRRGGWAPGAVVGGLAAGAIIGGALASRPYYYGGSGYYGGGYYGNGYYAPAYAAPVYSNCWRERRPVYDSWGNFRGYRAIRVCG